MENIKNKFIPLIIAITLVFGVAALLNTEFSYAASKTPAKVTGLKIKRSTQFHDEITIAWKKDKNAKKYLVYEKYPGKSWELRDETKSCKLKSI